MHQNTAIEIKSLRVQFGKQVILPELTVSIPEGKIIGLLGPSGSGKTTLVKSIIGTNRFRTGSITVFDNPVPSFAALAEIGYMAQNDALYDDLSARDNLLFFGRLYGLHGISAQQRVAELLDFVDLGDSGSKAVRFFSGGMRRRLSLAIALINHPRLLILDEPTVGMDPVLRRKFWNEFESLRAGGCTILTTTHVMDEAVHCDRIILLREGNIIADGTLATLLIQAGTETLEAAFLHFTGVTEEKEYSI
jgi:ABC-2 type transport system ATP-binding protein